MSQHPSNSSHKSLSSLVTHLRGYIRNCSCQQYAMPLRFSMNFQSRQIIILSCITTQESKYPPVSNDWLAISLVFVSKANCIDSIYTFFEYDSFHILEFIYFCPGDIRNPVFAYVKPVSHAVPQVVTLVVS